MAGKLGPRFAFRGIVRHDWMKQSALSDSFIVLQLNDHEAIAVETFCENFRAEILTQAGELSPWIFCAQIIKEDSEQLYAFASPLERAFFDELKELNSVGPKTAALIVGRLGIESLWKLTQGDALKNYKVSGLGPKSIEKIVKMVQDEAKKFDPLFLLWQQSSGVSGAQIKSSFMGSGTSTSAHHIVPKVLLKGLEQLGMRASEVQSIYDQLFAEDPAVAKLEVADLMRLCLKRWGQIKAGFSFVEKSGE